MNKDARIQASLPAHPKTKKLLRALGPGGGWFLVRLFLWVAVNRPDGDLLGILDDDLELAIDWPETPGAFVAELARVGFVDGDEGQRRIHGWEEHNPWAAGAAGRAEASRFAALCKRYGSEEATRLMEERATRMRLASDSDAGGVRRACEADAPLPSPSPMPSPKEESPNGDLLPAPDGGGADRMPECPHQAIIDLYHQLLPTHPRVKVWTKHRSGLLRARWRESPKRQSLDYWRRFFEHITESKFLTGQQFSAGRRPFLASLAWLVEPENFAKVIENQYHDGVRE